MDGLYSIPWLLVGYVVPFIVVLSLLVFVHEMGHYLAGRWSGIRILAFSVGFGPEIAGFTDRHGTRWKISAIPLGGYVRFFGDEDAASRPDFDGIAELTPAERETTMAGAKLWKRAVTVAAGPIANFILAIAIFAVVFAINGKPIVDPVVAETRPGSAAAEAGVLPGDVLLALDGQKVATFDDVRRYVSMRPDIEILVTVKRGEETLDLPMIPKKSEITDQFGNKMEVGLIGIVTSQERGNFRVQELSPLEALGEGSLQTWHIVTGTFDYLSNLVMGRMSSEQLGGPVRIAKMSGEVATLGITAYLTWAAMLSVSIGLLNLMPVPVLDGGHLVFYAIEAVRGRPVGPGAQEIAFRIGLVMILSLMVFSTWNDFGRPFG